MKELWKIIIAGVGALIGNTLSENQGFIYALVIFMVIDYITGVMKSIVKKELSSDVGFKGIFKKMMIFAMVIIGHVFDYLLLKEGDLLQNGIIFFYLSNEGLSILENACFIGLPIPEKLKDVLLQLRKEDDKKRDSDK